MAKPSLQQLLKEAQTESPKPKAVKESPSPAAKEIATPRQIHKPGEVNISAYFPKEVKAALRMAQAKTGMNVKQCLAEALQDFFRKHNVPVTVPMDDM